MRKQKSLTVNFLMNIMLTMSSIIFPIITFPYVSRILLPEGTGRVSFATSVVTYFSMFAQLGIPTYGIRACAKVRENKKELSKIVHELFIINIIMCAVSYTIFFVALLNVPRLRADKPLYLITSFIILFNAIGMEWVYKALERYTYITVRSVLFKFVALIAMFLFVKQKEDYLVYGITTIFAASASGILNFINIRKHINICPLGPYQLRKHLRPMLVFFAMSCAATIYTNLDTVMLGFMKTNEDVGYYNAAVKIKGILVSVVTSLGAVLLPRSSYYIENGLQEEFFRISKKALNFVVLVATPLMLYFIFLARESIFFLSGEAYEKSILPMQIIMPTLLFIGMTNLIGMQMLVPLGKEKYVLYSEIAGAIVDLLLNALLIPYFASVGAAVGTLIAEIVVWVVQCYYLKVDLKKLYMGIRYGLVIGAAGISCVSLVVIKDLNWNCFLKLIVSSVVYFGIYFLILSLKKETLVLEIEEKLLKLVKRGEVLNDE